MEKRAVHFIASSDKNCADERELINMVNELLGIQYNIAKADRTDRKVQNLASYINEDTLKAIHKTMDKRKAYGIDKVTKEDYERNLEGNLANLVRRMKSGSYRPNPTRRVYIPKETKGKMRPLGISCYEDKLVENAIAQILEQIYEPKFYNESFGFRPNRNCHQAVREIIEMVQYRKTNYVVEADIRGFFDNVEHGWLMKMLSHDIADKRFLEIIEKFLKAGVMENGLLVKTTEGSPQGGPLSPLLANIYLNEYDKEMASRGVPVIRYADDIVVLAKSPRAAQRLLESTQRYLEGKLKLRMNVEKSKVVSVFAIRNFKFLGFALGKGKNSIYIRAHTKSLKKAKVKLKELTSRSQGRNVRKVMENVKVYIRGWLGYFGIASMRTTMQRWDKWLRRRFRMYIWKQWKKPKTRVESLIKLGVPKERAWIAARTRKAYWRCAAMPIVQEGLSKEILARAGYYSIQTRYEQVHLCD